MKFFKKLFFAQRDNKKFSIKDYFILAKLYAYELISILIL